MLVLVNVFMDEFMSLSKNEDVEDNGEFDVEEANEPQLALVFLLGSSFRYFSIS